MTDYVLRFDQVSINDVELVGGKNASLGEMIGNLASAGVEVPNGFATTADAYREFLSFDGLDQRIAEALDGYTKRRYLRNWRRRYVNHLLSSKRAMTPWQLLCGRLQRLKTCRMHHLQGSKKHT